MKPLYPKKKSVPANGKRCTRAASTAPAPEVEFKPTVRFEPVIVPLGNGSFEVKAGKPIIEQGTDEITVKEAAGITGLSLRRIQSQCDEGFYREGVDWRQPGGPKGKLFLKRASVLAKSGKAGS